MGNLIKRYLPKSLLGRSILIIVTPLVLLQVVSAIIFFESHWDKVTRRLARTVAGDIAAVDRLLRRFPAAEDRTYVLELARQTMHMRIELREGDILPNEPTTDGGSLEETLANAIQSYVGKPFRIDTETLERHVIVDVQLADAVLRSIVTRKRLFSSTTYVFVLWMVGTSLILFAVATIFMRNQVKPIRRLAVAAENFGKGREVEHFKAEGAMEVRQAASAFLAMQERIQRQISQRTDMLSGVSHDLRTPLTRMKLQLEFLGKEEGIVELKQDVQEMEHMLEGYLAFARGEGGEAPQQTELGPLLEEICEQVRRHGAAIDLHVEGALNLPLRPNAFRRAVTNLIENASRYAKHVSVRAGRREEAVEIVIDDDGPGIPADRREEVFKPFYRLEGSRNPGTGGVGLGLTIARDVVRGHGGEVILGDSPTGGLRARIRLPL